MIVRGWLKPLKPHRMVILSLGLYFGWLLSLPMLGPVLLSLAQARGIDPYPAQVAFLAGHGLAFLALGRRPPRRAPNSRIPAQVIMTCALLSLSFPFLPAVLWVAAAALLGILSAVPSIRWVRAFAGTVPPDRRGRVMGATIALANVLLYGVNLLCVYLPIPVALTVVVALLLLAGAAFARLPSPAGEAGIFRSAPARTGQTFPILLLFIAGLYLAGGFTYSIVQPAFAGMGNLNLYYGLLPYILLVLGGGAFADRQGRRLLSYLSLGMLGIAFTVYPRIGGIGAYLVTQTLLQGAFALADLFVWVTLADFAAADTVEGVYGRGLGVNVLAILAGVLLSSWFGRLNVDNSQLASSITVVSLFFVLTFLLGIPETLPGEPPAAQPESLLPEVPLVSLEGLTTRELEILNLSLQGKTNAAIARQLGISVNTLKTHLKHIYEKTGSANKKELLINFLPKDGTR